MAGSQWHLHRLMGCLFLIREDLTNSPAQQQLVCLGSAAAGHTREKAGAGPARAALERCFLGNAQVRQSSFSSPSGTGFCRLESLKPPSALLLFAQAGASSSRTRSAFSTTSSCSAGTCTKLLFDSATKKIHSQITPGTPGEAVGVRRENDLSITIYQSGVLHMLEG